MHSLLDLISWPTFSDQYSVLVTQDDFFNIHPTITLYSHLFKDFKLCFVSRSTKVNLFDLNFDRRIKVDYQDSIKYMDSDAFEKTYGGHLIWKLYKRNGKSHIFTDRTRPNCLNQEGFLDTSYPCPICRDEYLVLHPENVKLLEQFIDPNTGKILTPRDTGLCIKQNRNLIISVHQAKDLGTLTFEVPDRLYDYKEYYSH